MASNNLFPTPTVDKNGRQTTVYRRSGRPLEPLRQFPSLTAPDNGGATSGEPNKWEMRQEMLRSISKNASDDLKCGNTPRDIKKHVMVFPDDLLERIEACQKEAAPWSRRVNARLVELSSPDEVSETIHFAPLIDEIIFDNYSRSMIQSLHYYRQLPKSKDYSGENHEVRSAAEALIRIVNAAYNLTSWNGMDARGLVIEDEEFVALIMENSERADVIADAVLRCKSFDTAYVREVLSTDAPSLSRGVL